MIAPVFQSLSEEHSDCAFYKVDVDDGEEIASDCKISSMPTFQFYKNGNKVYSFSGCNETLLKNGINNYK